jgi:hypothetical protein
VSKGTGSFFVNVLLRWSVNNWRKILSTTAVVTTITTTTTTTTTTNTTNYAAATEIEITTKKILT